MAKKETAAPEATQEASVPALESLNVQDLIILKNIIDVTASRGAIRPDEMQVVGGVHAKVVAFLKAAGVLKDPVAPATTEAPAETPAQGE